MKLPGTADRRTRQRRPLRYYVDLAAGAVFVLPAAEHSRDLQTASMVVTLIGYRATGKTTVAPALAARLGWTFVDADQEIERVAGQSIKEIFAAEGEPGFRARERAELDRLLQSSRLVLSAGGGAVLNPETRAQMRQSGPVVWLQASVDTIVARMQGDAATASRRPALTDATDPRVEVARLLAVREPLYAGTATIVVPTEGRTVADIVETILEQCPAELARGDR